MILIIQTVRPDIELIILDENLHPVANKTWTSAKDEVSRLLPATEELLKDAGKQWNDIKKIVVFNGIGGFSSTRIGVTIANTLAMSAGAELYELSWPEDGREADTATMVREFLNQSPSPKPVKIATPLYKSEPMISQSKQKNFN